jgi:hypothetical protein
MKDSLGIAQVGLYILIGSKDLDAIASVSGGRFDNPHRPWYTLQAMSTSYLR